jgi:hypothetical protein
MAEVEHLLLPRRDGVKSRGAVFPDFARDVVDIGSLCLTSSPRY